jgi:hypothetical protein
MASACRRRLPRLSKAWLGVPDFACRRRIGFRQRERRSFLFREQDDRHGLRDKADSPTLLDQRTALRDMAAAARALSGKEKAARRRLVLSHFFLLIS